MQDLFANLARQVLGHRGHYGAGNVRGGLDSLGVRPEAYWGSGRFSQPGLGSPFAGGDPFTGRSFSGFHGGGLMFPGARGLVEQPSPQELPGPARGFSPQGSPASLVSGLVSARAHGTPPPPPHGPASATLTDFPAPLPPAQFTPLSPTSPVQASGGSPQTTGLPPGGPSGLQPGGGYVQPAFAALLTALTQQGRSGSRNVYA